MSANSAMPWRWRERPTKERVLVFASRFDGQGNGGGRRSKGALRLMRHSLRIRKQVLRTPGAIGVSLYARPIRGEYYTVSAWQDEASLMAFARTGAHRAGVRDLYAHGNVNGVLISWWADADNWQPSWDDAIRRTAAATPGPFVGPDASVQRSEA